MSTHIRNRSLLSVAALLLTAVLAPAQAVDTFFNRNLPAECEQRMQSFAAAGQRIVCVAFPPAGGNRFSIVTEQTFFNRNVPTECHDQMVAFQNAGHRILCVAFPPGGGNSWSVVTDRTFMNRNIPQECHDRMVAFANAGQRVRWVAFPPGGGNSWSVITETTFMNRNIPQECHDRMVAFQNANDPVRMVAFPPEGGNRWTVLSRSSFFNRGVPTETHRVMRAMVRLPGGPLQMVGYAPAGNAFTIVSAAHPDGIPGTITVGNEVFSMDRFAQNLRQALDGRAVKYGFVVRHGQSVRSHAAGQKRTAFAAPAQPFSIHDRFNPASVTKTVTALALLDAMSARGVGIDDLIWRHLPAGWTIPASVRTITFRELLQHRSGFRTGGYYYDELRQMVAAGINLADKVPEYSNLNYALARVLVAGLDGFTGTGMTTAVAAATSAQLFRTHVQTRIFDQVGTPGVGWTPEALEPTLFFPNPAGSSTGTAYGDWSLREGSAGVQVSLAELVNVLDRLRNSTAILDPTMRSLMDTHNLGWDRTSSTKNASVRHKGGYFPGSWNGGAELHATLMRFDNGIDVAAVVNGELGVGGIVLDAYVAAWAPVPLVIRSATTSLPNLTAGAIEVTGQNLDAVASVRFGNHVITNTDPADPTRAWFRALSSTRLLVHPPQGLALGSYRLVLANPVTSSNGVDVALIRPTAAALLAPPEVVAGQRYELLLSAGNANAAQAWFGFSRSTAPSEVPGVVRLGIGDGLRQLDVWPNPASIDAHGIARFSVPSIPAMLGQRLWYQGLLLTPTLPLPTTNVDGTSFR